MVVVAAVIAGLFFVFLIGYVISKSMVNLIYFLIKRGPVTYRSADTENNIEMFAVIGGVLSAMVVFVYYLYPGKWSVSISKTLVVFGIIFGILTFIKFGFKPTTYATHGWNDQRNKAPKPKAYEPDKKQDEEVKEKFLKTNTLYRANLREIDKNKAEIQAIRKDLCFLISLSDNQNRRRGKLLRRILTKFFELCNFSIKKNFKIVYPESEGSTHIEGVIKAGNLLFLVEMLWSKDQLGLNESSHHLFKLFNQGYTGSIFISNWMFAQSVINSFKEILPQKIAILCELEEFVILLEKSSCFEDYFNAKILAAIDAKNPLFKPLM